MNFFGQNIFTIMNIQIIVFSHLNIQTIALLSLPGFTDACSISPIFCLLSGACIITIHYHQPQYQCVTGGDQVDGSESQDVWGMARLIVLGLITIHNLHNLH